jgi:hypothetical protein
MPSYDVTSPVGQVRLLLNDTDPGPGKQVFTDAELQAFLALEDGSVKLAAAQAIDTNADNEVLASKVITTRDGSVNGASVAQALHARAAQLRAQALTNDDDQGYFEIIDGPLGSDCWSGC